MIAVIAAVAAAVAADEIAVEIAVGGPTGWGVIACPGIRRPRVTGRALVAIVAMEKSVGGKMKAGWVATGQRIHR